MLVMLALFNVFRLFESVATLRGDLSSRELWFRGLHIACMIPIVALAYLTVRVAATTDPLPLGAYVLDPSDENLLLL